MTPEELKAGAEKVKEAFKANLAENNRRAALARWAKGDHRIRRFSIPLEVGIVVIPEMSEDDYSLLTETLRLWKSRIIKSSIHMPPTEPSSGKDGASTLPLSSP